MLSFRAEDIYSMVLRCRMHNFIKWWLRDSTFYIQFLKQFMIYQFLGDVVLLIYLSHSEDQERKLGEEAWRRKVKYRTKIMDIIGIWIRTSSLNSKDTSFSWRVICNSGWSDNCLLNSEWKLSRGDWKCKPFTFLRRICKVVLQLKVV